MSRHVTSLLVGKSLMHYATTGPNPCFIHVPSNLYVIHKDIKNKHIKNRHQAPSLSMMPDLAYKSPQMSSSNCINTSKV